MHIPANTKGSPDVGLPLGQRRRRWPDINPILGERFALTRQALGKELIGLHLRPYVSLRSHGSTLKTQLVLSMEVDVPPAVVL